MFACQNQSKIQKEENLRESQTVWFKYQKNVFEEETKKIVNIKSQIASLDENDDEIDHLNIALNESQKNCIEIASRYNASAFYFNIENVEIEKCN